MQIIPVTNYLLVRVCDPRKDKTIILPEKSAPLHPYAEVISVGPKVTLAKPGDKILPLMNAAIAFQQNGEDVFLILESHILAHYEEDSKDILSFSQS